MSGEGVKCINGGSVSDLPDEDFFFFKKGVKMRRIGRGGGKKEGEEGLEETFLL